MSTEFVNRTIRSFSQTRWEVRAKSLQSIFTFYKKLNDFWDQCLSEYEEPDVKVRAIGIKTQMKGFDFFFGIHLGCFVLSQSDNLSATLQTPNMSSAEAQKLSRCTVDTIVSLREKAQFNKLWDETLSEATILEGDNPKLPRKRKAPQRIEKYFSGNANPDSHPDIQSHYHKIYHEAHDFVISAIQKRVAPNS